MVLSRQSLVLRQNPGPFEMVPRLDPYRPGRFGDWLEAVSEEFWEGFQLRLIEPLREQLRQFTRNAGETVGGRHGLQLQDGFEQMHMRVLLPGKGWRKSVVES